MSYHAEQTNLVRGLWLIPLGLVVCAIPFLTQTFFMKNANSLGAGFLLAVFYMLFVFGLYTFGALMMAWGVYDLIKALVLSGEYSAKARAAYEEVERQKRGWRPAGAPDDDAEGTDDEFVPIWERPQEVLGPELLAADDVPEDLAATRREAEARIREQGVGTRAGSAEDPFAADRPAEEMSLASKLRAGGYRRRLGERGRDQGDDA